MYHHELMQEAAKASFWDSNVTAAVIGAVIAWTLTFIYSRASLHRQRAELLLKMQRQLIRQFRDLMVMREFYEPVRHANNAVNQMRIVIHGFCQEKISLSGADFILEYLKDPERVDKIADADSEYQCLLSTYQQWTHSYQALGKIGLVRDFDFKTGKTIKDYEGNDAVALHMHADYSKALIQTLDRAVKLNMEAANVVNTAVDVHRKKLWYYFLRLPRTPSVRNVAKGLDEAEVSNLKAVHILVESVVEAPYAVLVGNAREIAKSESRHGVISAKVSLPHTSGTPVPALAVRISFQDAARVSRLAEVSHFYWIDAECSLLVDAWFYMPSIRLGATSVIVGTPR